MRARKRWEDSGAVMVMATFFALFLVGLVYHVAGVGHAALEQQIMQDAADSVAFSAATAKARGMNVIAMLNLVMAVVLAVLVAIRVLVAVLAVATAIVGVLCIVTQGAACGAVEKLADATRQMDDLGDEIEDDIKYVLEGLESAADVVAQVTPILAEAEAVYISTRDLYDPAELGFVWPIADELPVKEGSFEELCEHAAENVVYVCELILPGDLPEVATDAVGELVAGLAGTFSAYFCGGSDSAPPSEMEQDRAYPIKDHTECDDASRQPDPEDGSCGSAGCEACAAWGCAACIGRQESSKYRKGEWTLVTSVRIERVDEDGHAEIFETEEPESDLVWLADDPCDGEGSCGSDPICEVEEREDAGGVYPAGAERVTVRAYTLLHGCVIEETIPLEVQGEPLDADEWPKPKALDEEQVPEGLRLRSFVVGATERGARLEKIAIAGGDPGSGGGQRLSFAAADFLSPDMDLWHMNWRSRLIRFRTGGGGFASSCSGSFATECSGVGGVVDGYASGDGGFSLPGLDDYIVH